MENITKCISYLLANFLAIFISIQGVRYAIDYHEDYSFAHIEYLLLYMYSYLPSIVEKNFYLQYNTRGLFLRHHKGPPIPQKQSTWKHWVDRSLNSVCSYQGSVQLVQKWRYLCPWLKTTFHKIKDKVSGSHSSC